MPTDDHVEKVTQYYVVGNGLRVRGIRFDRKDAEAVAAPWQEVMTKEEYEEARYA